VLHKVASGQVNPPHQSGPLTPLLLRMLDADPAARPPMTDVAHTLAALHSDSSAATSLVTLPLSSPPPITPPPLSRQGQAGVRPGLAAPLAAADLPMGATQRIDRSGSPAAGTAGTTALPVAGGLPPRSPAGPGRGGGADPERRRSGGGLLAAFAVAALLIGAIVLAVVLLNGNGGGKPSSSGPGTTSRQSSTPASSTPPRTTASTSTSASASGTASQTSASASSSAPQSAPSAAELSKAIRDYYGLLPENTDAAWNRLTERFQNGRAGGRDTYDSYWASIKKVSVRDVTATPPGTVVATVKYDYKDGRSVSEKTTFGLVSDGGILKIDSQN